jgi:tungstate transport system permease protein
MHFLLQGLRQAFDLLAHPDADLRSIFKVTLELAMASTLIALLLGVPAGLGLGLGRFRGRRLLLAVVNTGLGLPPVVVGLVVALLLFRNGPAGSLRLLYTVRGMIVAQVVLSLPLVTSLVSAAATGVDAGLLAQARALGASGRQVAALAAREARVGVIVAAIAALGSALSEVGAVVLVGGNIDLQTRTAAGAILTSVSAGRFGEGIAIGILLLGLVFLLAAGLTVAQHGTGGGARRSLALGGR